MAKQTMPYLLATLLALAFAGCTSPAGNSFESVDLAMENFQFSADELTVAVGSTVTWTNEDAVGHTVTPTDKAQWATDGSGDAQNEWLQKDESWSFTFTEPGTYTYYCIPHASQNDEGEWNGMVATIVVTE